MTDLDNTSTEDQINHTDPKLNTGTWVTPGEFATLMKVSLRTIYRWLEDERIESVKVVGRHRINKREALTKLGLI